MHFHYFSVEHILSMSKSLFSLSSTTFLNFSFIPIFLSYFKFDYLDPETLHALAQLLTLISSQIQIIFEAVKSFVNHLDCPELAAKAMMFASLSTATARTTQTIANDAAEVSAAFKGTPLAMSKTARYK